MPRRARWWHQLQASKAEALLAVDIYNRPGDERRLEAFIVHMQIAWLYLLHARLMRDGLNHFYRDQSGRRVRGTDGEFRTWELAKCLKDAFPNANDPVRGNVEFFIGLRNKIEHRYEGPLDDVVSGRCQSLVLNFEEHLVGQFGAGEGLGRALRFPVFLSTLSDDAVDALKRTYQRLPRRLSSYIETFDASKEAETLTDWRFEFRVLLVPVTAPKSDADVSMRFVRSDELDGEARDELNRALTIVRDRTIAVQNKGRHTPGTVSKRVGAALGCAFAPAGEHVSCWRYYNVRPPVGSPEPSRTNQRYCFYDEVHHDYIYTEAWIEKLIRELGDEATFLEVTRHAARPV